MKAALHLAVTAFSIAVGVLATPSPSRSGAKSMVAPPGLQSPAMHPGAPETLPRLSAAADYWVCITVSPSALRYGWYRSGDEASAFSGASAECGLSDCTLWACAERGCVGIDFGDLSVSVSYATGFGSNDPSVAASRALAECQSQDTGCRTPGYFCAGVLDSGPAPDPTPTAAAPTPTAPAPTPTAAKPTPTPTPTVSPTAPVTTPTTPPSALNLAVGGPVAWGGARGAWAAAVAVVAVLVL